MKIRNIILVLSVVLLGSCSEDWFETSRSDQFPADQAFNTTKQGRNVLNGIFSNFQVEQMYGANLINYAEVKGTDVRTSNAGKRTENMYAFQETTDASVSTLWSWTYNALMNVNYMIAAEQTMTVTSPADEVYKNYLYANAYAIRALMHFELVRIYGKMPANGNPSTDLGIAILTEPISADAQLPRNTVAETYAQIFADLDEALRLYPADVTPVFGWFSDWSIKALYARTSLYYQNNANALTYAEDIINNGPFSLIPASTYVSSWGQASTSESILTIVSTADDNPSREGIGYLWSPSGYSALVMTQEAVTLLRSTPGDVRANLIAATSYGYDGYLLKYPGLTYNNIDLFRLSEMYLIAAEAALKTTAQSKADDYIQDLVRVRTNNPAATVTGVDLNRILLERRKELIGEGHRFYDLMRNGLSVDRTGSADHLLGAPLTVLPTDYRVIQPIPRAELDVNSNIIQNDSYLN